jgi:hypothetical protein
MFAAFLKRFVRGEIKLALEFSRMVATGATPLENGHEIVVEADRFVSRRPERRAKRHRRAESQAQERPLQAGTTNTRPAPSWQDPLAAVLHSSRIVAGLKR